MKLCQLLENLPRLQNYLATRVRWLSLKKAANVIKAEYSRVRGKEVPWGMPYEYIIDPTNICQLRCPLCATGSGTGRRSKGRMSLKLFQKIIAEIRDYALHIFLYNWGEPLLLPDLPLYIRYAVQNNIPVSLSSNLSLNLTNAQIEDILTSGLSKLVFSADGASPEVYRQYRLGGDWQLVEKNVASLIAMKKKLGLKKPVIEWQYLLMQHNLDDVEKAKKLARCWGVDMLTFSRYVNLPFVRGRSDRELARQWLLPDEVANRRYYDVINEDVAATNCWWLWRTMIINWDGGVSPCCYAWDDPATDFGNLSASSCREIWCNDKYRQARRIFTARGQEAAPGIVCTHCSVALAKRDLKKNRG